MGGEKVNEPPPPGTEVFGFLMGGEVSLCGGQRMRVKQSLCPPPPPTGDPLQIVWGLGG